MSDENIVKVDYPYPFDYQGEISTGTTFHPCGWVYVRVEEDLNGRRSAIVTHLSPHRARTLAFDLLDAADAAEQEGDVLRGEDYDPFESDSLSDWDYDEDDEFDPTSYVETVNVFMTKLADQTATRYMIDFNMDDDAYDLYARLLNR